MSNFDLANLGSNVENNGFFKTDLYPLGTLEKQFTEELNIEALAEKDAEYYIQSNDDSFLSGANCINQQIDTALNIGYTTVHDIGSDCVKKAQQIFDNHNTDNFKDSIQAKVNEIHTKSTVKLTGYTSQYMTLQEELTEYKSKLKNYQEKYNLENIEPQNMTSTKRVAIWCGIVTIIWAEAFANAFLFQSDIGSMYDQAIISTLLSILNSVFGFFTAKSYTKTKLPKKNILSYIPLAISVTLIFALNLAIAHYRNVALSVTSFADMDTATIESLIADPLHIVGFKTWVLFFLGVACSYFSFTGYSHLIDPHPAFTQMYNHVKEVKQDIQKLMDDYNKFIRDLEKEGNDAILELYAQANSSLNTAIAQLSDRYFRYYSDLQRFETYLQNLYNQITQDYKTALITKIKEKNGKYTAKKTIPWKPVVKKIHDFSAELKELQNLQVQNYNPTEIGKIYTEHREKLNNMIYSLLTPFKQGEQQ